MNPEIERFDDAVASLTAQGQAFEINTVELDGVEYLNFASLPANLGQYFLVMLQHAQKDFAVYLNERYTYAQGYQHSCEFGAALVQRYGLAKGDRVAILALNSDRYYEFYFGVAWSGGVFVPVNTRLAPAEIVHRHEDI